MEIQYRPHLSLVSSPKSVHLPNTVLFLLACLSLSTCKVACEGPAPETQAQRGPQRIGQHTRVETVQEGSALL